MIVKPKTISAKDKEKLNKNGVLVVEHPLPMEVRFIREEDGIDGNAILMSAMKGVVEGIGTHERFAKELYRRMQDAEAKFGKAGG